MFEVVSSHNALFGHVFTLLVFCLSSMVSDFCLFLFRDFVHVCVSACVCFSFYFNFCYSLGFLFIFSALFYSVSFFFTCVRKRKRCGEMATRIGGEFGRSWEETR